MKFKNNALSLIEVSNNSKDLFQIVVSCSFLETITLILHDFDYIPENTLKFKEVDNFLQC